MFRPLEDPEVAPGGQAHPRYMTGKMNEESVQALLLYALDTGRLANAKDFL